MAKEVQWNGMAFLTSGAEQINNCTAKGRSITDVDFLDLVRSGTYVNGIKRDGSGDHTWCWVGQMRGTSSAIKESV